MSSAKCNRDQPPMRDGREICRMCHAAAPSAAADGDPADLVAGTMRVQEDLARMDPRTRAIVALRMDGYRQEEIAEMLGETSVRAVEGVLYRWRVRQVRLGSGGGD